MEVIWKDLIGFEGYYKISNTGLIIRCERHISFLNAGFIRNTILKEKLMKPHVSTWGYLNITIRRDKLRIQPYIHVLVAENFIGKIPKGYQVNHIDGNKLNNNDLNLEIVTVSENHKHAYKIGLRPKKGPYTYKLSDDNVMFIRKNLHLNCSEIARMFNVNPGSVWNVRFYKSKKHVI